MKVVETVTIATVSCCEMCGKDLSKTPCRSHERRTKIDIVFERVVSHVDAEIKYCADYDTTTQGQFPADMPGPIQYGLGLKAYLINLAIGQMMSLNRIKNLIKSMIGIIIAEATILKYVLRLYVALEPWSPIGKRATAAQHYACGRNFIAGGQKKPLDPRLFRWRDNC